MDKYKSAKIYKIVSNHTNDVYIGSTTQPLHARHSDHKRDYEQYQFGKKNYVTSFEIIKHGDSDILLIENFPCSNRNELHSREGHYIKTMNCVNKIVAGRDAKEYYQDNKEEMCRKKKQYRSENKDVLAEKKKLYYKANRTAMRRRMNQSMQCICGKRYTQCNKSRHFRSSKHQQYQQYIDYCEKHDELMYYAIRCHQSLLNK